MVDFDSVLKFSGDKNSGAEYKNSLLKKNILAFLARTEGATIADLSGKLNISIPTVTKLVAELKEEGYLIDHGKIETAGAAGRLWAASRACP